MAAVTNQLDLEPVEAQAANVGGPAMLAAAAGGSTMTAASSAIPALGAVASMWAPLAAVPAALAGQWEATSAASGVKTGGVYEDKTESVTDIVAIDNENEESLTVLPQVVWTT